MIRKTLNGTTVSSICIENCWGPEASRRKQIVDSTCQERFGIKGISLTSVVRSIRRNQSTFHPLRVTSSLSPRVHRFPKLREYAIPIDNAVIADPIEFWQYSFHRGNEIQSHASKRGRGTKGDGGRRDKRGRRSFSFTLPDAPEVRFAVRHTVANEAGTPEGSTLFG